MKKIIFGILLLTASKVWAGSFTTSGSGTGSLVISGTTGGGGTGNAYTVSCSSQPAIMSAGNITMCSFPNVPALTAGSCYTFEGLAFSTANYSVTIAVDGVVVSSPVFTNNTWGTYNVYWRSAYCNNIGTQTSQQLLPMTGYYLANSDYGYGQAPYNFFAEPGGYPIVETDQVNWATTHTVSVIMNNGNAGSKGYLYDFKME